MNGQGKSYGVLAGKKDDSNRIGVMVELEEGSEGGCGGSSGPNGGGKENRGRRRGMIGGRGGGKVTVRGGGIVKRGKEAQVGAKQNKGKSRRSSGEDFQLESPFVSALMGKKSGNEENILWKEIGNLKNQIKSLKKNVDEEMRRRKELEVEIENRETRVKELVGRIAGLEKEKKEDAARLVSKREEVDGLRDSAGRKLEVMREEREKCKVEIQEV